VRRRLLRAACSLVAIGVIAGALSSFAAVVSLAAPAQTPNRLSDAVAKARASTVTVLGVRTHETLRADPSGKPRAPKSLAAGFVFDARGHVVTVASAVRECDEVWVRLADGRERSAMLIGLDETLDIALLQLAEPALVPLRLAPAAVDPVGQAVAVLGPGVGPGARDTRGRVHKRYERPLGSLLLLDNPVYPGFSGAPAVNDKGELLGVIIGHLTEAPPDWADTPLGVGNASFAVAGSDLRTIVAQLERYGQVRRGFLGVRMVQGTVVDQERPGDPYRIGVRVEDIVPGGPAAQLGLKVGDLIVGWNGETLQSPEDLMRRVENSLPGTIVPLVWVRDEERREGRLIIGARPDDALLATPMAGGGADAGRKESDRVRLLQRMDTLRGLAPIDTSRGRPGG
jgi:serine protease Do